MKTNKDFVIAMLLSIVASIVGVNVFSWIKVIKQPQSYTVVESGDNYREGWGNGFSWAVKCSVYEELHGHKDFDCIDYYLGRQFLLNQD